MNKHTLGPWNCNRASAGGRKIVVSEVSPVDVAVLSHHGKTQSEIDANARLIAAAPELLEALEKCLAVLKHFPLNEHDMSNEAFAACAARIAIEKATGIEQ